MSADLLSITHLVLSVPRVSSCQLLVIVHHAEHVLYVLRLVLRLLRLIVSHYSVLAIVHDLDGACSVEELRVPFG